MGFRGCENKFDMRWRFFQRFEQGVEGFLSEHVHFIYIDDTEISSARSEPYVVPEIPDVINAAVGCSVYFKNIQAPAFRNFFTYIFMRVKIHFGPTAAV